MKIFYLSNSRFPSEQSRSLSIVRLCQAFAEQGHQVLLSGYTHDSKSIHPADFYGLDKNFDFSIDVIPKFWSNIIFRKFLIFGFILGFCVRKKITRFSPDLIYTRLTIGELLFIPRHIPILYEMHSLGPLADTFYGRWLFKFLIKRKNFKTIVVTTQFLKSLLKKELPQVNIVVARLSAETPLEIGENEILEFKKNNLKNYTKKYHIGFTGYIDKDDFRGTSVICRLAKVLPHLNFHIVGGEEDSVIYWKDYSKKIGVTDNLFFYGYRKSSEIPFFLSCFDVVLAPLQFRPSKRAPTGAGMSPLKISQYLAYGKAIVASDIPSHREILVHDKNSLLVTDLSNMESWARAVESLLGNENQKKEFCKAGKDFYFKELTPQIRVKKILNEI